MPHRLTPLGWITGGEGLLLCLVPAVQHAPFAAAGGVAMLAALAAARLLTSRALAGVRVDWEPPRAIHAGVETTLAVRISAVRPAPPLDLWSWDPRLRTARLVGRLAGTGPHPGGVRWTVRFPVRGLVVLPPPEIAGVQPMGLVESRRVAGEALSLVVLPPLGRIRAGMRARLAEWFAGVAVAPESGGDDLGRLRAYAPGDARTRIHWRASARHQQLLVAERHAPAARRLAIVLDTRATGACFERLVAAAATLVDDLDRRGWELTLHHGQAPRGICGGRARLLESLALSRSGGAALDETVPRGMPCLALLDDATAPPACHPPPLVVRDGELPRLIHLPRRLARSTG